MTNKEIARIILNVIGLIMMAAAFYHFGGIYAVIGFMGWILRYQNIKA